MRVFVLTTGRSGSATFARACHYATNYTSGHESRTGLTELEKRLDYPDQHIEADRHLAWMLGPLDRRFDAEVHYVHLVRDERQTALSWARRMPDNESWIRWLRVESGLMIKRRVRQTFADVIGHKLFGPARRLSPEEQYVAAVTYVRVVNANIEHFLRDKKSVSRIDIGSPKLAFQTFWDSIGATGQLDRSLREFDVLYNASLRR